MCIRLVFTCMYRAELPVTPGAQWDAGVLQPPLPELSPAKGRAVWRCEMPVWSYRSWPALTDFSFCCFLR